MIKVDNSRTLPGATTERALALSYAPADARDGLAALLALDERLGAILRTTREPLVGQMRLTWWYEALEALDRAPAPAEPVLAALRGAVVARVPGAELARQVEGWEALLETPLTSAALEAHASARGGGLFGAAAALLGAPTDDTIARAGEGWALADLMRHLSDPVLAAAARDAARSRLSGALDRRWPPRARALGALAWLARLDLTAPTRPAGHPARAARLLWHRLSGR
ncbi:squalene/phytoene synthase family protein [Sphingomonas sp. BK580]|uniref:squalene/phytoene synthase family protein n=1 Tax=Sphingomonas sp. BK580 TaxID=2586972 RepID=UPI001814E4DA|nr:squalene/phytoene synthase family protein [Sphingomonas sp. BK580]MBB3692899.1 phytoene synthase [Sphingomonas sp. BK580]